MREKYRQTEKCSNYHALALFLFVKVSLSLLPSIPNQELEQKRRERQPLLHENIACKFSRPFLKKFYHCYFSYISPITTAILNAVSFAVACQMATLNELQWHKAKDMARNVCFTQLVYYEAIRGRKFLITSYCPLYCLCIRSS